MRADLQKKVNDLISCGYPIFIIAGTVAFPAEADDFFTPEEMEELEAHIRAERM